MLLSTYDSNSAKQIGLSGIKAILRTLGVNEIYIKRLSPNDNSKNQPYFGKHLTDLSFIPTGSTEISESKSKKTSDPKRKIKYQVKLELAWIDAEGHIYSAPNSKLIYYPQYPEVRFSGFLKGSQISLSRWMDVAKDGRSLGRWLVLGVSGSKIYAYLATPNSNLANELEQTELPSVSGVFNKLDARHTGTIDTRSSLLSTLLEINQMGWVPGQKLGADLISKPYRAANGGGYTLESLLGITPNGYSEPDYLGWEIKQFGIKALPMVGAKPTTLLTPEPDGGIYKRQDLKSFMLKYGYPDRNGKPDRLNFGGRHIANRICSATNLTLKVEGFDAASQSIENADGSIELVGKSGEVAASWSFPKLMDHWKRKHSQAAYIPCQSRTTSRGIEYQYGSNIKLGVGTTFELFLSAMIHGYVYYDPGIKLENISSEKPKPKKRSQFRVNHKNLVSLYKNFDNVDLKLV